jgi:hypothetical protein
VLDRPVAGEAQVGGLNVEAVQPTPLIGAAERGVRPHGQLDMVESVATASHSGVSCLVQPLSGVLGDGLQQPVADTGRRVLRDDQRPVDEAAQQARDLASGHVRPGGTDRLSRLQREPVGVHGHPTQNHLLRRPEQVPAPIDDRPQGAVAARPSFADRQQGEAVVQPLGQSVHAQAPDSRGGQLQRQRQTVQPPTDGGDRRRIGAVEHEPRRHGGGPFDEELYGARPGQALGGVALGQVERLDWPNQLPRRAERFATRGQNAKARRRLEQRPAQRRHGTHDVLAVVQDEQHRAAPQRPGEASDHAAGRLAGTGAPHGDVRDAQDPGHVLRQAPLATVLPRPDGGRPPPGQLHQPRRSDIAGARRAAGADEPGCSGQGEASLPDPAGTRQGHEPTGRQALDHAGQGRVPADQVGQRRRQVGPRPAAGRRLEVLQAWILGQDRLLQAGELPSRGQAEVLDQPRPELLIAGQGVRLAPGPVQRPHVGAAQPLPPRVAPHQLLELADQGGVLAEGQPGVHQVLQRRRPLLLQPSGERQRERRVRVVGQRRAPPQPQRLDQARGNRRRLGPGARRGHQATEPLGVDRLGVDPQDVARRRPGHQVPTRRLGLLQRPAELRHLGLQGAAGPTRRVALPQVLDQAVGRHRLAGVDEQVRQQGTHLRPPDGDSRTTVGPRRERPEQTEPHGRDRTAGRPRPGGADKSHGLSGSEPAWAA